ncbi:hypothetical protein JW879_06280 [candidate division WOR-3 bacterium]|nr:hypothetical protein [candidate division WOR-3 bacterium]
MRIWSLHPKYLDNQGLLALWRETLLAKKVLEGKTKGYKNHPQLERFKKARNPSDSINQYLATVYQESVKRGYNFNKGKIKWNFKPFKLNVKSGQLNYEKNHLLKKLKMRDIVRYKELKKKTNFEPHPLFKVVEGDIEEWEII